MRKNAHPALRIRRLGRRIHQIRQHLAEYVGDPLGEDECRLVADILGQVAQILLIPGRQDFFPWPPARHPRRPCAVDNYSAYRWYEHRSNRLWLATGLQ